MVLERTKQILKNHEGHEYCGNGVSYHVFLYPIDAGTNPEEAIRTFLLSEIYDDDKDYVQNHCHLALMENGLQEIENLLKEWHISPSDTEKILMELKEHHAEIYSFGKDHSYFLGSVSECPRYIHVGNEWYLLEFCRYD